MPFSKVQSKLTRSLASAILALSVIASRCHLSQGERPWQSAKFPGLYFTPCCRKGSRRRYMETFRLGSLPKIAEHLVLRQTFTAFSRDFTGKEL